MWQPSVPLDAGNLSRQFEQPPPDFDLESLKSLSDLGIDMSFLPALGIVNRISLISRLGLYSKAIVKKVTYTTKPVKKCAQTFVRGHPFFHHFNKSVKYALSSDFLHAT